MQLSVQNQKPGFNLGNLLPVIEASKKDDYMVLKIISCIHYPVKFKKNKIKALINLGNKSNTMILVYTSKLDLNVYQTNIGAKKIDSSAFEMFIIMLVSF